MKKVIAAIMAICMSASLAACSNSGNSSSVNKIVSKAESGVVAEKYTEPQSPDTPFDASDVAAKITEVSDHYVVDNSQAGGKGKAALTKLKNDSDYVVDIVAEFTFLDENGDAIDSAKTKSVDLTAIAAGEELYVSATSSEDFADFKVDITVSEDTEHIALKSYISTEIQNEDTLLSDGTIQYKFFNSSDKIVSTLKAGYILFSNGTPIYVEDGTYVSLPIAGANLMKLSLPEQVANGSVTYDELETNLWFAYGDKE
jgi:hypothetical protein